MKKALLCLAYVVLVIGIFVASFRSFTFSPFSVPALTTFL